MGNATQKKLFGKADLAIIIACFLWALSGIVTKNAIGDTPESFRIFIYNSIRISVASMLLFATGKLSGKSLKIRREHILSIVSISFFGMFLNMVCVIIGLKLSNASNMGIMYATAPLFILLISFVTGIEHPTKQLVLGVMFGITGLFVIFYKGRDIHMNPGDLFLFASVLFWAIYTVFGKKILENYIPLVATAWILFFTAIFHIPLFFIQLPYQTWTSISLENWINLCIGTLGSFVISMVLFYYSIHKLGPVRVGLYNNLEPIFLVCLAYLLRGETITLMKITGFVIILIGIVITKIPLVRKNSK